MVIVLQEYSYVIGNIKYNKLLDLRRKMKDAD